MKIDRSSYGAVALVWVLAAVVSAAVFVFVQGWIAGCAVSVLLAAFAVWQTVFHSVPDRSACPPEGVVLSAADGRVVAVKRVMEREHLCRECMMVSVYMNFWDVHANYWPVNGEVCYNLYHPGKHFLAFKPKASEENEHACNCVRTSDGSEIFFKQLAGGFARRISCYAVLGDRVRAGEQCGIIKFGSRLDMYLPLDAQILVSKGESVTAGVTSIAKLKSKS